MHFTLRQLAIFEAVAEHLSYTRAAEVLHLSQPAVSMQIRQLEENVGLPLFEQLGRRTYLTDAGRELIAHSKAISRRLREVDELMAGLKGLTAGRLKVSVATTANEFGARMLASFSQQHVGVSISLDVTNRQVLLRQLETNERDLVIMGRPPEGMDVVAEAFMVNPLVIITPPQHPLLSQSPLSVEQLAGERFVVREQGSGTRNAMKRFFDANNVHATFGMELGSNEAIKQVVAAGLSLAMVSAHTIIQELQTGRLAVLPVIGMPIMRSWYLVQRRGKRPSPIADSFRSFVLQRADEFCNLERAGIPRHTLPLDEQPYGDSGRAALTPDRIPG